MSLQFEDQSNMLLRRNVYDAPRYGFITSFLLKHNIAKDEKSANRIMIILAIIILIFALSLATINIIKANTPTKVKYNVSKKVFNSLPEDIQIKLLSQ